MKGPPRLGVAGLRIRPGQYADLAQLVALEAAAFTTDRLSPASFRRLLRSASADLLVAECEGVVLGYAVLLARRASRVARLYSIARRPDAPRGLGTLLLTAAEGRATARGTVELRLEVRPDNAQALRLYEASGYRRFGRLSRYYQDGADAIRMRKRLV